MPFWRFAVVVVILTTFTATLRHRLVPVGLMPTDVNSVMAVVSEPIVERFFMPPAPLRPEEGAVFEAAAVDSGVRPAYAIATLVGTIGIVAVTSRDVVPLMVTRAVEAAPLAIPALMVGLALVVHTIVATAKQRASEIPADD